MPRARTIVPALCAALALAVLAPAAGAATFQNTNQIQIVDKVSGEPNSGTANPYPSQIQVTGVPGGLTDIQVTLNDLTHSFLDDVAIVLESPANKRLLLMNRIGPDSGSGPSVGVVDFDFTFDDAGSQLDANAVPTSGSGPFKPTNHQGGVGLDSFPSPGPGTSYSNPGPALSGSATLQSVFGGGPANGTWRLYVIDSLPGDSGDIGGGWALDVTADGDATPPDTQILTGPTGTIAERTAQFTFSTVAPEPGATFECRLDAGAWAPCNSPRQLTSLADGTHTFRVRALDAAQNVDLTPAEGTFTVDAPEPPPPAADRIAPEVTIDKVKVKRAKRTAKVSFTGSDNVTPAGELSFTCKLDGKAPKACTSPATFKRLKPGKHTVTVTATDAAGNVSGPAVESFKVKRR